MSAVERLKDHVVAALRIRRPIPGTMKCDEDTVAVPPGKLLLVVPHHVIRRPVCGKRGYRRELVRTNAYGFAAIASVFGRQHQFFLERIVIALGPAIVATFL